MKLLKLILLFSSTICIAQKSLVPKAKVSSGERIEKAIGLQNEEKYEGAIVEYNKVGINDTNYVIAQYNTGLCYLDLKKYKEAQKTYKSLIDYKIDVAFKCDAYLQLGLAYSNDSLYDLAEKTFAEAIKLYPYNHLLVSQRGSCYEAQKKYDKAIKDYQAALTLSPVHGRTHLKLGLLCLNQKFYSQAYLSLMTYLFLNPENSSNLEIISIVERVANGSYENKDEIAWRMTEEDVFQSQNTFFENKVALRKEYKTKFTVSSDYAKQFHLIASSLKKEEASTDFWIKMYGPFYQTIFENDELDLFVLSTLLAHTSDDIKSKVKSKLSKIQVFYPEAYKRFKKLNSERELLYKGKIQKVNAENDKISLNGIGKMNADNKPVGDFYVISNSGKIKISAFYNEKGEESGNWTVNWNEKDIAQKTLEYKDNGERLVKTYYITGEKECVYKEKDMIAYDSVTCYYQDGTLKKQYFLKDELKEGDYKGYYPSGQLQEKYSYKAGVIEGDYTSYHPNKKTDIETKVVAGQVHGTKKEYDAKGQLIGDYIFVNGNKEGPYAEYYENGQIRSKGTYHKGIEVNLIENFYSNGNKKSLVALDANGKMNGKISHYDLDGILYQEQDFKGGNLVELRSFDKKGVMKVESTHKGKTLSFVKKYPNGTISEKGQYLDNISNGKWEYFDHYGNLQTIESYTKGALVDSIVEYHANGKIKSITPIEKGYRNGEYKEYNSFGDLTEKGFYVDGNWSGEWLIYRPNGAIEDEMFFVDGNKHGYQKEYDLNNRLLNLEQYDNGRRISYIGLDTNGSTTYSIDFFNGKIQEYSRNKEYLYYEGNYRNESAEGLFTWYGPNNKILTKGKYLNDERTGEWTWYYLNGKAASKATYLNSEIDGISYSYYEDGTIEDEIKYTNGAKNGPFTYYHYNGKPSLKGEYFENDRHGKVNLYNQKGELMLTRYYNQGILEAYSYLGTDGKEITPIKISTNKVSMICYYPNGQKSLECTRLNGDLEGKYTEYSTEGKISEEGYYQNGESHGIYKEYYENGVLRTLSTYIKDYKNGEALEYYPDGKLKRKTIYVYGTKHGWEENYSADGKISNKTYYQDGKPLKIK